MLRTRPRPLPQMSRTHLEIKFQNEYCLIGLSCPVRISTMHLRILKLLDTHVHHDEVACTSKVKVTLRGQRSKEYCLIGLPCPARISTMHLRILKLLDTHGHHDEVACISKFMVTLRGQRSKWLLFDRTALSGPHLYHASKDSQVTGHTCSPWWGGLYLKGQGHGQR